MKVKELHCSGKHQNYWVKGHGGRSISATRFPDFSGNNGSWPWGPGGGISVIRDNLDKITIISCWERGAVYAFTDLQANVFT